MLFNSTAFLFLFLPITWFIFWRLKTKEQRYIWLAITGYVFYSFWNVKFCLLMLVSTGVSYFAGLGFLRYEDERRRRFCLIAPIVFDLAMLGFFKYANFGLSTGSSLLNALGFAVAAPKLDIVLPVGISFYTFHTITYIVDSYRRVITPTRNFSEFACYVSLFAQLVAGPIVRFREIEKDLDQIDAPDRAGLAEEGTSWFVLGLAKKVLLADSLASIVNPALAHWETLSTGGAWMCMLGYSYQLYFDFSGYSEMAIGLGLMFGLRLPQNFNSPYRALDIADFWRRWHISLSSVLRDYLYIPLGGNRNGEVQTYRNLLLTMLLGGLWHGAGWTFIIWGGYHGALLGLQRAFGSFASFPAAARRLITFLLVIVGWTFFRADNLDMALGLLQRMFLWQGDGAVMAAAPGLLLFLVLAASFAHFGPNLFEISHQASPLRAIGLTLLFALAVAMIYARPESPFLYFQF
jgi:alginate O-acetyltransferase complex protein AlgI